MFHGWLPPLPPLPPYLSLHGLLKQLIGMWQS